jgi:mannose-1-phosphate guanylyltransferase/mannose-6-phosphate isomerase
MDEAAQLRDFGAGTEANARITPVLLCGGAGMRLWPVSRADMPKQFAQLGSERTLFQETLLRVARETFEAPVLVTSARHRFLAAEQAGGIGAEPTVIVEPEPRNTAAAALAAAIWIARQDPDRLMLILPCDHHIPDADSFAETIAYGAMAARAGRIVTFGVTPTRPETGYGWLQPMPMPRRDGTLPLARFIEKPDAARALRMFKSDKFLWNMGVFLCSARTLVAAFTRHAPDYVAPVRAAIRRSRHDLGFLRLDEASFAGAGNESLDVAVMEKASNLSVLRFDGTWSDMGDWDAVGRVSGGAESEGTMAIDCQDTVLRADGTGIALVGIGLSNVIAVATPDAVLVADRSRAQDVRIAVAALREKGVSQADRAPRTLRPWGSYEVLTEGAGFKVKRITVLPGARLSLQSHDHRAEHWVLVAGEALVTNGGMESRLLPNQSTYIPAGQIHRLANPGSQPAILIEVQTGAYLGEDDIHRFSDDFAREAAE